MIIGLFEGGREGEVPVRVNYGLLYLCSYLATCSFIFVFANIENSKWREYEFTIDGKKRDRYIEWKDTSLG